jgi:tryptophan halogenase
MRISNILIVGGGSSGWMTAAALSTHFPQYKITLIESSKISTVGVGESTLGHFNKYLDLLDLKDEDWMKECNATYKTSIKFTDFKNIGSHFHYPFGRLNLQSHSTNPMDWFNIAAEDSSVPSHNFAEFYHDSVIMTDHSKLTKNEDNFIKDFNFKYDTAYHLDAELFGKYLKNKIAIPKRVVHIDDQVVDIKQDINNNISGVITENNGELTADLYIDCTGFKALLIEETMKSKFISFNNVLMNNSAIAMRIPYIDKEKEMELVTNCTAIQNGWVWNIPLWNRIGTGYVYSSKFVDKETAEKEFRAHLAKTDYNRAYESECFHIKIKHGIHERPWIKNVVAIGLSCGFIEPLESTGLLTTHENILRLVETLMRRDGIVNQFDIDMWNYAAREEMEGFKQFISIHYGLSARDDTEYWRHVTNNVEYESEVYTLRPKMRTNILDLMYKLQINPYYNSQSTGETYIATGMGYNPFSHCVKKLKDKRQRDSKFYLQALKNREDHLPNLLSYIDKLPSHYEFLRKNIYKL